MENKKKEKKVVGFALPTKEPEDVDTLIKEELDRPSTNIKVGSIEGDSRQHSR